ncbi:MAG: hypothetical protein OQK24_12625 [Magnetovibrio sp.]|nr:hypothetical protein [Magnetovibrio sp.]
MSDITNVSIPVVRPSVQPRGSNNGAQANGYQNADEVNRRASVLNAEDSPQNIASLNRLDRILSADKPLRTDVPRGFYLDLKV